MNPTKNGKLRRLDITTARLLESVGYRIIDYHKAMLFDVKQQKLLDGNVRKEYKGRLSFFKRLSAARGNVVADHEDIIIAIIPNSERANMTGITSPPYFDETAQVGFQYTGTKGGKFTTLLSKEEYGSSPEQIGNLKDTALVGVTSPPYRDMIGVQGGELGNLKQVGISTKTARRYSKDPNNIGNLKDD